MTMTEDRPATTYDAARRAMIDSQLRTSGVTEAWVVAAMGRVPREQFVPAAARDAAYTDRAVPLGDGRFLAAPLFHGRLLAEAAPAPDDRVLLVGDGKGYLAALLAARVTALDAIDPADAAGKRGGKGAGGPYSLILVDGAVEEIPEGLAARLAEGGRIVTGVVERGVTRLATGRKSAGAIALWPLAEIGIPVLPAMAAPRRWSF